MVDAIISAVVEDLTSMMLSTIKEEVKLVTGVNDEVKKLVRNFNSIKALLDDAEEQQLTQASVRNWLFDLKTVSYDMDDVIDEWKTWIQTSQRQLQLPPSDPISTLKHKVFSIFRCNCFTLRDVGLRHVIGGRIKEIHQKLDDIAKDKDRYQFHSIDKSDKHIVRPTTPFVDTQTVKGRDEEKNQVKSKILEAKSNPHIVSLVGSGGIGKTTLAKLIYNDGEIQNHFEKIIWVCVSQPFDEMRVAKAILESLDKSSSTRDLKEFCNVVTEIRKRLNQKRFLLILDDVWNENRGKWVELEQSLKCGLLGSTILVTTRKENVAIIMGCNYKSIHKVGLLNPEECWSIISQVTLVQGDDQRLEGIGRRIAEKCKGLPLVANTVGGILRFKKSEKEWLRVLEKKEWKDSGDLDPLKLSYYDLPLSLKQCFKYCAIFPKDYRIKKERLIRMWMAQGYLRGKEEKEEDLEIVGETYVNNLIARSLFQIESSYYVDDSIILHDMVSDLAQTFAKDECLMIEVSNGTEFNKNSLRSNANARHLTLVIEKDASFPVFIYGLNKLRSLNIQFLGYGSSLAVDAVKDIFDHLTCLRTLDLSNCGIKEVPSSINGLVHLRWLDLSENRNLEKLPESLCECYNLQTLNLLKCDKLSLSQGIGKLINLMYLNIWDREIYLSKGIGNLQRLKEMRYFRVYVYENGASSIVEMEKLNNIRGTLTIRGLGNVRKVEEARKAQLMKKKNVTYLGLFFDGDHVQEDEEELLEALEPPSDLETLSIEKYEGKTLFPSWVMKLNLLRVLNIINCRNCEELPPLGKLSSLELLYMKKMRVKRVGVEFLGIEKEKETATSFLSFPKLVTLEFSKFLEWEEWADINGWLMESFNNTITVMPCLNQLRISKCPKLKTLPYCLLSPTITPKLQSLTIYDCPALRQIQNDKLSHIPYFHLWEQPPAEQEEEKEDGEEYEEEINLQRLKETRYFWVYVYENGASSIVEMEKLNNIRGTLTIRGLGNVRKVEEARKAQLTKKKNITDLELGFDGDHVQEDEEELLEALEPPSDLERLSIEKYEGKTLFPSWVMKLNLLKVLTIINCRNCEELPPLGKLSSLEELFIREMRVKRVGVEFLGIEKEKETATSFLSFPKLKTIKFSEFLEWEEWDDIDEWLMESFNNTITVMPCLEYLCIFNCPKLKTLPYCLLSRTIAPKLQWLDITRCHALQPIQIDKLSHIPYLRLR